MGLQPKRTQKFMVLTDRTRNPILAPVIRTERGWFQKWFRPFSFLCGRGHSGSTWESKAHTVGTLKGATWARSRAWERWQAGQNDSLSTIVSVLTIA
jgi:hypothetical protein